MIPKEIVKFLARATIAMAGTRDKNLVPHVHRVSAWIVNPDGQTLTCLVMKGFTDILIPSLEDNSQLALTVCEVPSHETYQFKGIYVGSRPVNEADFAAFEDQKERSAQRLNELLGFPVETTRTFFAEPSIAISFQVREIYLQTPGPEAGRKILPREE